MSTPQQRIAAGYAEHDADTRDRDEKIGREFRQSDRYDELIELQKTDPDRFDRLPRSVRMACGLYEGQREAARRAGLV